MNFMKALMLALLTISGSAASAQQALSGVRQVAIVVENLQEDAANCWITKDGLDAAVRIPLSNSRIRIIQNSDAYVYVNVNSIFNKNNQQCYANLSLSFNKYAKSEESTGAFWSKEMIIGGRSEYVSRNIYSDLETFTKQFIAAWLKANP